MSGVTLRPPENEPQKRKLEDQRRLEAEQLRTTERLAAERAQMASDLDEIRLEIAHFPREVFEHVRNKFHDVAVKLVNNLKIAILNNAEPISFDELRSVDVPTADIERDCETLKEQILFDQFGGKQPCYRIGESVVVPVDHQVLRGLDSWNEDNQRWLSNEDAVEAFGAELVPFLSQRVASQIYFPIRGLTGGMNQTPLMLPVTVRAYTLGARVSYSPSYFVNYQTLASPTSPVQGMLLPGRYIFMISAPNQKLFDQGLFNLPPDFDISLLV